MTTLNQLLNQGARPSTQPDPDPDPAPKTRPAENARLCYLTDNGLLPPYVTVLDTEPDATAPNTWSRQAANDWPKIARNLGLPEGTDPVPLERGLAVRIGDRVLAFDLDALWRHLNIYEEADHAFATS